MGHQNDKLDPAFTMRRNLPRNISNELELLGFKLEKKILGLRNMQKKLDFFSYNCASDLFWLSRANHWIELDYRSPFLHLQFFPMIKQSNASASYFILLHISFDVQLNHKSSVRIFKYRSPAVSYLYYCIVHFSDHLPNPKCKCNLWRLPYMKRALSRTLF